MSKHTPKPWYAVRDPSHFHSLSTVVGGSNQELVVQVGGNAPIEEQEANARLIAAAPDLYAIVRAEYDAHDGFKTLPLGYPADRASAIVAAIAKAEGGGK